MNRPEQLLERLDSIGQSLSKHEHALLLLGVGSVGTELERLDSYSDLDFFVFTEQGYSTGFIENLDWLNSVCPLSYHFRNTEDGCKIMFDDGIYGEFAVFDENKMTEVPCNGGRIIWSKPGYKHAIPSLDQRVSVDRPVTADFALNEAITNIYVGLCRFARGEKLSAKTFIETYAMNQLLSVLHLYLKEQPSRIDSYNNDRRIEQRYPDFAMHFDPMLQGYDRVPQSAIAIFSYIERIFPVNEKMSREIKDLAIRLGATLS
ncbi:hypothetical protein DFP94_1011051 [Fontibacillus phaseoli]|uniref:Streptomycin adenylyltransferase n=1 Tax=Fontibacillus phaseoli TaxID=1416533 RepID=A0A369BPB1_9BACL|nr:hypothetical protein [Fontibacillus phaseoli]RCX23452.1 hypothetical protein DFP94_1011051 [Fontibacillus phaseoli]